MKKRITIKHGAPAVIKARLSAGRGMLCIVAFVAVSGLLVSPAQCRGDDITALDIYAADEAAYREASPAEVYARQITPIKKIVIKRVTIPTHTLHKFNNDYREKQSAGYRSQDAYRMPLLNYSRISSSFGMRYHPLLKRMIFHNGCDIPMPYGTPVYSAKPGIVTFAGWKGGYGYTVEMRHYDGSLTRYGHLSAVSVRIGKTIEKSKNMLGRVGSTGMSTGPHLHFEIISPSGESVNPLAKMTGSY